MSEIQPITKPLTSEYPEWFAAEIEPVTYQDLILGLSESFEAALGLLKELTPAQLTYRYQPEKWTIKEIWQHIIDVERVLAYRVMRYSRNDKTILSGFNEKLYVEESKANARDWSQILQEYEAVRKSSLYLFRSLTPEMLSNRGTAGRSELTVRAVGYLILGHNIHHLNIIKERYL